MITLILIFAYLSVIIGFMAFVFLMSLPILIIFNLTVVLIDKVSRWIIGRR